MPNVKQYNGMSFPFRLGIRGGVATSTLEPGDLSRIRESIVQILNTYPGERVMEPSFGCKVKDYIFEPDNPTTKAVIAFEVRKAIERWEKRVEVGEISVYSAEEWKAKQRIGEGWMEVNDGVLIVEIDIFVYKYQLSDIIIATIA